MADSSNRTLVCSIVFLDIVEYSKKPVAEQMQLKQVFNGLVGKALEQVAVRDRVVLDTGDGAAVTFLGDPEDALFVAMSIRDAAGAQGGVPVRMGINLGPVRLVRDINSRLNIIGDGINVAQRVMSFAQPGQLLVSRSFYEVVSCLSREYADLFGYVGARTDKHVRAHEVYEVSAARHPGRRAADSIPPARSRAAGALAALAAPGPFGLLRATFLVAPLVFFGIIAAAAQVKHQRDMFAAPQPVSAAAPKPVAPPRPAAAAPRTELAAASKAATNGTGKVQLAILPWGEVLVDGRSRGASPPLKTLELAAGSHTIEVRNTSFPPHVARIVVRAGEQVPIRHRFK
jgi:class 3 adenylate cyclase